MVLAAEKKEHLQVMALEQSTDLAREELDTKCEKAHSWSWHHPDSVMLREKRVEAEDAFGCLGSVRGGAPEIECRILSVWKDFQAVRRTLVCRGVPMSLWWERWRRHAAPILGYVS